MPSFPKTIEMTEFSGLNNVLLPERTPGNFLKVADNIDIDKSGGIHKRPGYSLKLLGDFHSLWGSNDTLLCVKDGKIARVRDDFSVKDIVNYQGRDRVSFTSVDESDDIFFVSQGMTGHILKDEFFPFGLEAPTPPNLIEVTGSGGMSGGTYQVALTYVDELGEESGARVAKVITIEDGSSIVLQNIVPSVETVVTSINIYCSMPNGDTLYKVNSIPNASGNFSIKGVHSSGVSPLQSFNIGPAPHGDIISYYRGRLYIADGRTLWYSSPFSLKWFNLQSDFLQFENEIVEVMPVENGIWIGTTRGLYHLGGKSPEDMKLNLVEPVSVVRGTGEKIVGAYLFIENTPIGYKWLVTTEKGVFVCFNNGIALNLTETNVVFPEASSGVSSFIQKDGINRYLTLLEKKKPSNNASAADIVTATIVRNGIVI